MTGHGGLRQPSSPRAASAGDGWVHDPDGDSDSPTAASNAPGCRGVVPLTTVGRPPSLSAVAQTHRSHPRPVLWITNRPTGLRSLCPPCSPAARRDQRRPSVWYVAYCVFMALLYGGLTVAAVAFLLLADRIPDLRDDEATILRIQFGVMLVFSVPLAGLFGVAPMLPKRRAAWIYGLVLICIGMTSACCLPATIPLLIFWIKPETKEFFAAS